MKYFNIYNDDMKSLAFPDRKIDDIVISGKSREEEEKTRDWTKLC